MISPPAAVLVIAVAKERHGACRLQSLLSLPLDETNVLAACAPAICGSAKHIIPVSIITGIVVRMICTPGRLSTPLKEYLDQKRLL